MTHAESQVQFAIDDSIREDRIVYLKALVGSREWAALSAALGARADDYVTIGSGDSQLVEYWGARDDGSEWRIHLDGRLAD